MIGKNILHYKILEKLGEGGMGVVYLAEDTKLERKVAIKFLPGRISANSDERKRFEQEAKAAASLNHPNIATIHAIEYTVDDMFIVMEYIEGKELKQIVDEAKGQGPKVNEGLPTANDKGPMNSRMNSSRFDSRRESPLSGSPTDHYIDIASQITAGLQAAHEKGIVHRDIKASNIMITDKGHVKIMDFGLAKYRGAAQLTQQGTTVGTAAYMSPEQARGDETNHAADIWSFGVVLYELLTGTLPFKGDYEQAVIYSILNESPQLDAYADNVPDNLKNIVQKSLEKNPDNRYKNAGEILSELKQMAGSSQTIIITQSEKINVRKLITRPKVVLSSAILVILIIVFGYKIYTYQEDLNHAREVLLPQIEQLADNMPWTGEGLQSWQAYEISIRAQEYLAGDPHFEKIQEKYMATPIIKSDPPGADVYVKPYSNPDAKWHHLGQTPIKNFRLPISLIKIKIEKQGFEVLEDIIWIWTSINNHEYSLTPDGQVPAGMIKVSAGNDLGTFFVDRYEVRNQDYKLFIDQGGYKEQKYWKHDIYKDGRLLPWKEAVASFIDKTGITGPATWEVGNYPEGQEDFPVAGVSWYEAEAYAQFVGKGLPTLTHWRHIAALSHSAEIIPFSNLNGSAPWNVGISGSMNRFGIYDMAGNVREWCWNSIKGSKHRLILGGGWNDADYLFNDRVARDPLDRSVTNGIRCVQYLPDSETNDKFSEVIDSEWPDYYELRPVSDEVFSQFASFYSYDKKTPRVRIDAEEVYKEKWRRQVVVIDAAYNNEDLPVNIFFPNDSRPPYQAIIYFPGTGSADSRSSKYLADFRQVDFFLKSGRVVVYPVYKGTYERNDKRDTWNLPVARRNMIINWVQDYSRVIDYLETRDDIDTDKLDYYGFSMGGWVSPLIMASEKRLKAGIIYVAGFIREVMQQEVNALNYAPRVKIPILMLNGKYDSGFPVEKSQRPLYDLLGTPPEFKKWVLYDNGHSVPRPELIKESLNWMDTYLGPVAQ